MAGMSAELKQQAKHYIKEKVGNDLEELHNSTFESGGTAGSSGASGGASGSGSGAGGRKGPKIICI